MYQSQGDHKPTRRLSRRDYVLLETVLREQYSHYGNLRVVYLVAKAIGEALKQENPSFNVERFLRIVEGKEPLPTNIPPENYIPKSRR